jgi:hypothetical protein
MGMMSSARRSSLRSSGLSFTVLRKFTFVSSEKSEKSEESENERGNRR